MSYKLFSKQYENETLQLSIFLMTCTNAAKRNREMYPECVIASWDALILLLDAENIEWRVQLDAEKNRMFMQIIYYKLQKKTASHDTQICVSWKQFLSTDWLFGHGLFRCKFSD